MYMYIMYIYIYSYVYIYIYTCSSFQLAMSVGCLAASHFIATGCFCLVSHILDQIWGNRLKGSSVAMR